MTIFLLSHNLQVQSGSLPPWDGVELAEGLGRLCSSITQSDALFHPHWRIRVESRSDPASLAGELVEAWAALRRECGHDISHTILALGGRNDTPAAQGSPLELGTWGVDVVETEDSEAFLETINWFGLKASRQPDGVFEVIYRPS